MSARRAIIHNRVFWWLYDDGRKERIYANERIRAHLSQVASVDARMAKETAPKGRTNHPPRPPGTAPTLPAADRNINDRTLTELAHDYGWGSVYRFSEALRKHRRPVYEQARANGNAKSAANLNREQLLKYASLAESDAETVRYLYDLADTALQTPP